MLDVEDTIVGIASAAGGGARGIVRLSGPRVLECLSATLTLKSDILESLTSAQAIAVEMELPAPLGLVGGRLCVWPTPQSYTRQPSAEFHTVGAKPILEAVVRHCCRHGARLAEPGEFTLRAFLAGRLDLTQAEAVLGVIDAHDQNQLGVALSQLAGGLATPLGALRTQLLELLAHLEAGLDFVEEDIEFISREQLLGQLDAGAKQIDALIDRLSTRGGDAQLAKVVLVGDVNAGKSSLFNALTGADHALVSGTAGTTRDYLTQRVDLDGLLVEFVDTAGVQEVDGGDEVGRSSQHVSSEQRQRADLQLLCIASTDEDSGDINPCAESDRLVVVTKSDLAAGESRPPGCLVTSALTGSGVSELRRAVRTQLAIQLAGSNLTVPSTAVRCHESLTRAADRLRAARELAQAGDGEELVASELRFTLDELGKVVGAVYTDDILDRVFSRFCIGK